MCTNLNGYGTKFGHDLSGFNIDKIIDTYNSWQEVEEENATAEKSISMGGHTLVKDTYFDAFIYSYLEYMSLCQIVIAYESGDLGWDENTIVLYDKRMANMASCVVLGSLVIEAALNDFGLMHKEKIKFIDKHEKADTFTKWRLYTAVVYLEPRNNMLASRIEWLDYQIPKIQRLRNFLVHRKPDRIKHGVPEHESIKYLQPKHLAHLVNVVSACLSVLFEDDYTGRRQEGRRLTKYDVFIKGAELWGKHVLP